MIAESFYKKYGFFNFVTRWEEADEPYAKFGAGTAPVDGLRINDHYTKTIWVLHMCNDGKKDIKLYFTDRKSTEFRNLMDMKLNEAVTDGWISKFQLCCVYNHSDNEFGVSLSNDGNKKMRDVFTFNGDDYSLLYECDYNWDGRLDRLKTIGLVNSDNTIDNPFGFGRPPHVVQVGYYQNIDKRDICINFIGDVGTREQLSTNWNSKAYLVPDTSTSLTLTKQGTHDTLVFSTDFTIAGIDGGDDITVETGRPIKLSSATRTVNAGRRGVIFHVWK